jgi:hypothetical protein
MEWFVLTSMNVIMDKRHVILMLLVITFLEVTLVLVFLAGQEME